MNARQKWNIVMHKVIWVSFVAINLVLLFPNIIYTQTAESWYNIDAANSYEEFVQLEKFYPKSFQWNIEERAALLNKTFDAAKTYENDSLICVYGERLGNFYRELDSISLALNFFQISLEHARGPGPRRIVLNSLGGLHNKSKDFKTALDYYFQSIEEAKKLNDGSEAYPIGNISEVYLQLKDYSNSIKYLKYSIEFSKKLTGREKHYSLAYDYSYLINTFLEMEVQDSAEAILPKLLSHLSVLDTIAIQKYQDACFVGYFTISDFYLTTKQSENADHYITKTKKAAQVFYQSSVLLLQAENEILKKNYKQALALLNDDVVKEEYTGKADIVQLKATVYKEMGLYKEALALKEAEFKLKEEEYGNDRLRYSTFADVKYESLQKQEEIRTLKQDKEITNLTIQNQRYFLVLSLVLFVLFAAGAFFYWKQYQNRKQLSIYLQEQVDKKTKDLKRTNEELRVLNYVASHDIKEPIRNIGNFIGLIRHKIATPDNSELNGYFDVMNTSIKQLYTLVEDIGKYLSLSNDEELEQTIVNLDQVLDNTTASLAHFISTRNAIIVNRGLPKIKTNATVMFIVMKNLIENGLKFNESDKPSIELSYTANKKQHQLKITDNGIGIDQKFHSTIFQSFKRLHNRSQYEGSGIGLTIVSAMIHKLQGTIRVESEIKKGTTFIIELPI